MAGKCTFTEQEVQGAFGALTKALEKHGPLPTADGSSRVVPAGEFMLMLQADDGRHFFKHRVTRNYVILFPTDGVLDDWDGLQVPAWDMAFHRGTFDGYPEEK